MTDRKWIVMDQIQLGDVRIDRVVEFTGPVGLTPQGFFPGSDPQVWRENRAWLSPQFVDAGSTDGTGSTDGGGATDMVQSAVQTWVLRSGGRTILVDTGLGNGKERPYVPVWSHHESDYLADLAGLGISPEDVDVVVNTHLHLDHVGWNTRLAGRTWVPTFPNATYLVHRADYDFWNPEGDASPAFGRGNQNAFEDSVAPVQAAGQLRLWDGEQHRIDAALTLDLAAGHTPGSAVVSLRTAGESALFAADLLHSPLQVSHPEMDSCFCEDPAAARASRARLLQQAADSNALVLPAHFRTSGGVRVGRDGNRFTITEWPAATGAA